eukprot:g78799.t1
MLRSKQSVAVASLESFAQCLHTRVVVSNSCCVIFEADMSGGSERTSNWCTRHHENVEIAPAQLFRHRPTDQHGALTTTFHLLLEKQVATPPCFHGKTVWDSKNRSLAISVLVLHQTSARDEHKYIGRMGSKKCRKELKKNTEQQKIEAAVSLTEPEP